MASSHKCFVCSGVATSMVVIQYGHGASKTGYICARCRGEMINLAKESGYSSRMSDDEGMAVLIKDNKAEVLH